MNSKNIKSLLFVAGTALSLLIFAVNFTACSSHILDIQEGLQSTSTPAPTSHSITVTSGEHGTISLDKTSAAAGETVTIISAVPDIGYKRLFSMSVYNATENSFSFRVTGDSFVMPEYDVELHYSFVEFNGQDINKILKDNLGAASTATKFLPSPSAPTGNEIELYSLPTGLRVYAWLEGTTIYYYAAGYTDSNKKIPLVKSCFQLFEKCSSLQGIDMSYFDTSNVTNMAYMFAYCEVLDTLNLSSFNTTSVTSMVAMFEYCKKIKTLDLSLFDTSNVTDMQLMFAYCEELETLDLSLFDTSNVTDMQHMFAYCEELETLDLSSFNTSNVTEMFMMFCQTPSLKTIFVGNGFDTSNVTGSTWMFSGCKSLVGGAGTKYSDVNDDITYARIDGENSLPGYFTRK